MHRAPRAVLVSPLSAGAPRPDALPDGSRRFRAAKPGPTFSSPTTHRRTRQKQSAARGHAWIVVVCMLLCAVLDAGRWHLSSTGVVLVAAQLLLTPSATPGVSSTDALDNAVRQYLATFQVGLDTAADVATDSAADVWTVLTTYYGEGNPLNVDDSPYFPIAPPFLFPFNGRWHSRLWVNPNGALHLRGDSVVCCSDYPNLDAKCFQQAQPACNFDTPDDYTDLIAPFLADLDPGASAQARIAYLAREDVVKVRWTQVPFFNQTGERGSAALNSFQVDVYPSGAIDIHLVDISDPDKAFGQAALAGTPTSWLAGVLRWDSSSNDAALGGSESPERRLYAAQQASWATSKRGAYPFKTAADIPTPTHALNTTRMRAVQSNMTISYCAVAVNWCAAPTAGSEAGGQTIWLVASEMSCFAQPQQHQAECRFYPCAWVNSTRPGSGEGTCQINSTTSFVATPAPFDPATSSLRCVTPPVTSFVAGTVVAGDRSRSRVEVRIYDATSGMELATTKPLTYDYLSAADARAIESTLPTNSSTHAFGAGASPPYARLVELGIYPLLCTTCSFVAPALCGVDCAGVYFGSARVDDCQACTEGSTGLAFNYGRDCAGRCFAAADANAVASSKEEEPTRMAIQRAPSSTTMRSLASSAHLLRRTPSSSSSRRPLSLPRDPAYCACFNENVTSAQQAQLNLKHPLPANVELLLREFDCHQESLRNVADTVTQLRTYQYVLLALITFGLVWIPTGKALVGYRRWKRRRDEDRWEAEDGGPVAGGGGGSGRAEEAAESEEMVMMGTNSPPPGRRQLRGRGRHAPAAYDEYGREYLGSGVTSASASSSSSSSSSSAAVTSPSSYGGSVPSSSRRSHRSIQQIAGSSSSSSGSSSVGPFAIPGDSSPFVVLPMAGVGAALVLASGDAARRPSIADRIAEARHAHRSGGYTEETLPPGRTLPTGRTSAAIRYHQAMEERG